MSAIADKCGVSKSSILHHVNKGKLKPSALLQNKDWYIFDERQLKKALKMYK